MKILKAAMLGVILLSGAVVVYGWTTDCGNTVGVYISCEER